MQTNAALSYARPADAAVAPRWSLRREVPAWLLSWVLHLGVFVALALLVRTSPRQPPGEPGRAGGIVLVQQSQGKVEYFSEPAQQQSARSLTPQTPLLPLPGQRERPVDPTDAFPTAADLVASGATTGDAFPSAGDLLQGSRPSGLPDGQTQTSVFGAQGTGTKFIYVFDRSGSMEGYQGRPLAAAKAELIASLQNLDSVHQFQIIFYNDGQSALNPFGGQPRMMFGSERDKRLAVDFIKGVVANGSTRHLEALKMALRLKPDVIFFLTDADEPQMTYSELEAIRRMNGGGGCSIHAIEFGSGPFQGDDNFLVKLARQNGGQHVYVDVNSLPLSR